MTTRNAQTAIVLQGGGALGAYEYGVLKAVGARNAARGSDLQLRAIPDRA
jgi:predicted acylesterase/phospholipase RssA